eukprot:TRINITY_DN1649_c0_g1_i7.p1 TRINITY_DN1649_c0_g1~~TRINITY_DN1649_c0_g1_i7.p1  ORF type:complete len:414 (+),score=85.66 TRINITY_DN1649_c0_g1_i7:152-1393(+)
MNTSSNEEESQSILSESDTGTRSITESDTGSKTSASYTTTSDSIPSALKSQGHGSLAASRRKRMIMQWSPLRQYFLKIVESSKFNNTILFVIMLNTIIIAIQTDKATEIKAGWYLSFVDNIFLGIYFTELLIKAFVFRSNYFKSGWNTFDFVIVLTSFVDWLRFGLATAASFNPKIFRLLRVFRAVRALRGLRALRAVSFLQSLQIIVSTLLKSIPALSSIVMLLFLILFIFAVIGRNLYGDVVPENFGSIWTALFSLFSVMTLDDWFQIYRSGVERDPTIIIYLICFIILETFIFINLFIAVIVNNLQASQSHLRKKLKKAKAQEELGDELKSPTTSHKKKLMEGNSGPKSIDDYYAEETMAHRQKQLMGHYFMLLAALENNTDIYETQQRVLDELVDVLAPPDDEDTLRIG